jgi:hypothetical protein
MTVLRKVTQDTPAPGMLQSMMRPRWVWMVAVVVEAVVEAKEEGVYFLKLICSRTES